jgi:hypothetical protein
MFTIIAAPLAYNIGRASGNVAFSPGQTGDAPPAVSRRSHRYRMNIERQAILNFLPAVAKNVRGNTKIGDREGRSLRDRLWASNLMRTVR